MHSFIFTKQINANIYSRWLSHSLRDTTFAETKEMRRFFCIHWWIIRDCAGCYTPWTLTRFSNYKQPLRYESQTSKTDKTKKKQPKKLWHWQGQLMLHFIQIHRRQRETNFHRITAWKVFKNESVTVSTEWYQQTRPSIVYLLWICQHTDPDYGQTFTPNKSKITPTNGHKSWKSIDTLPVHFPL